MLFLLIVLIFPVHLSDWLMPFTKEQRVICKKSWNVFYEFIVSSRNNKEQVCGSGSVTQRSRSRGILYLGLTIPESELSPRRGLRADWRLARPGCVVNSHTLCCVMIIHRI